MSDTAILKETISFFMGLKRVGWMIVRQIASDKVQGIREFLVCKKMFRIMCDDHHMRTARSARLTRCTPAKIMAALIHGTAPCGIPSAPNALIAVASTGCR